MLVLGDLACPNSKCADLLIADMQKYDLFKNQIILCNLEGMIKDDEPYSDEKLFNHSKVLDAFESGKTVFSIANNHTYDYPGQIESTEKLLKQKGIYYNGVNHGSIVPTIVREGNSTYAIFTHCWRVYTETNPNNENNQKIIDCSYEQFFNTITDFIEKNSDMKVICYFHWNYDMETLPFPAYRKLAHQLIDAGVFAVIGNHSHVPQGGELYKGHVIVFGLGNFYIPSGYFFNGKLSYPEQSKKMIVLELCEDSSKVLCHWFLTDEKECLQLIKTERFADGEMITKYSPFRKMDEKEYLGFFKKNRVKRKLVPIFKDFQGISYSIKEFAAIYRIKVIKRIKH